MPRSVFNSLLLIATLTLGRACAASLLSLPPSAKELLIVPALTVAPFLFGLLGQNTRAWLEGLIRGAIQSLALSKVLLGALAFVLIVAMGVARVVIAWDGPRTLSLRLGNRDYRLEGSPEPTAAEGHWQAPVVEMAYRPITIELGAYSRSVRPIPFRRTRVFIPEYFTATDENTRLIESKFDRVLLQLSQKAFHERALATLLALKDKIGEGPRRRLQAISDLLEESALRSRDGDTPRNLLAAFEASYAGDPWLPALSASVALSERRYADAAATLAKVVRAPSHPKVPLPTSESLTAMHAVALTKEARDLLSEPNRRADAGELLKEARRSLERILREGASNESDIGRAALQWHLGMVCFYERSDEHAMEAFGAIGNSQKLDPLLAARARNAMGYLKLLNGELTDADKLFAESTSLSPTLATPRINRGYILLIQGRYEEGHKHFRALLSGPDALAGDRDKMLARLAAGLALDGAGKHDESTEEYEGVLRELRGVGAVEVIGRLRPVLLRLRLAREIYLRNRDYYALEVWGAVMLGSACRLLAIASEERGTPLFSELQEEINDNVRWVFAVAPPRAELLQHRKGILGGILPRADVPCNCGGANLRVAGGTTSPAGNDPP